MNINILWDLSDRIDSSKNPSSPEHYQRDIEVVKMIATVFKKDMQQKGAYKAKGRFRVFFTPSPQNGLINNVAKGLSYDLSAFTGDGANRKKKEIYDSIENRLSRNLNLIYSLTREDNKNKKQWDGSDIWRFFKNDVKDYCIEKSGEYRNILVLLTDGYIYHKDSKIKNGNRSSFILPESLKVIRKKDKWRDFFSKENYGLITTRNDLQNLEILVLEITPSPGNKDDEDIIKKYLAQWFSEMGVKEDCYNLYNSDLPEYTKGKIKNFFDRK